MPDEMTFKPMSDEGWLSVYEISQLFGISMTRANEMIIEDHDFDPEDVRHSGAGKGFFFVRASVARSRKAQYDKLADLWMTLSPEEQAEYRKGARSWVQEKTGESLPPGRVPRRILVAYMQEHARRATPRRPAKKAPTTVKAGAAAIVTAGAKATAKKLVTRGSRRTAQN